MTYTDAQLDAYEAARRADIAVAQGTEDEDTADQAWARANEER